MGSHRGTSSGGIGFCLGLEERGPRLWARWLLAARWAQVQWLTADDEPSYLGERDQLVLARVLVAQGDAERALGLLGGLAALAELAGALALAAPEGYGRVFLDEGAPMAALLDGLAAATGNGRPAAGVPPGLVAPLSEREADPTLVPTIG